MTFWKILLIMIILVGMIASVFYWISFFIKKLNLKYWFKYKLFKRKYNEKVVEMLMEYLKKKISNNDLVKSLLINRIAKPKEVRELLYIYQELKKSKGGKKHG